MNWHLGLLNLMCSATVEASGMTPKERRGEQVEREKERERGTQGLKFWLLEKKRK